MMSFHCVKLLKVVSNMKLHSVILFSLTTLIYCSGSENISMSPFEASFSIKTLLGTIKAAARITAFVCWDLGD